MTVLNWAAARSMRGSSEFTRFLFEMVAMPALREFATEQGGHESEAFSDLVAERFEVGGVEDALMR